MEQNKWELKSHSWQIADTGDYDGYWEITDGKTSICTKGDPDDERLEDVVKVLNSVQCNFYTNNDTELNQQLEIYQLKDEMTSLQSKCDRLEKERYETRLAMRMLLKVFRDTDKNPEQSKYFYQADYIFGKYHVNADVLRNEALNGEGEKALYQQDAYQQKGCEINQKEDKQ